MTRDDATVWWKCRYCGQALGVVREPLLLLGLLIAVDKKTTFLCLHCNRWQTWHDRVPTSAGELRTVG